jgi:hypothetical protein
MESSVSTAAPRISWPELIFPGCGKTQLAHTMAVITQLPKEMGGAEGKVAYIGKSIPSLLRYSANIHEIPKAPSVQRESWKLQCALAVSSPFTLSSQILTVPVDPDQACENIAYARAQNTEVSWRASASLPLPTFSDASRTVRWPCRKLRDQRIPSACHRQRHVSLPYRLLRSWRTLRAPASTWSIPSSCYTDG